MGKDTIARLVRVVAYLALGLAVLLSTTVFLLPSVMGSKAAIVLSGSMEPALEMGGIALIFPVNPSALRAGDIIAFNPEYDPEVTVCHRVIEVIEGSTADSPMFRTKGDANEDPDTYLVPASEVRGKVSFSIPHAGYYLHYTARHVRNVYGLAFLILIPCLFITASAARDLNMALNPAKRRMRLLHKRADRLKARIPHRRSDRELIELVRRRLV